MEWSVGDVQTSRMRPSGVEMYGASREDGIGSSSVGAGSGRRRRPAADARGREPRLVRRRHGRVERPEQQAPDVCGDPRA